MSKSTAGARLQKELMDLMMSATPGVSAFPENDNLFSWLGTIKGASATPYEGIDFRVALRFPAQYPFEPPTVSFVTPCYHPNVDLQHGAICLDILKENWSAVYTASQVLLSIQSLLDNPNNASPLNPTAAQMWHNKEEFRKQVCEAAKVAVTPYSGCPASNNNSNSATSSSSSSSSSSSAVDSFSSSTSVSETSSANQTPVTSN